MKEIYRNFFTDASKEFRKLNLKKQVKVYLGSNILDNLSNSNNNK